MKRQPEFNLENPDRPTFIITRSSDEFAALCARASRGEFRIEFSERVPQRNAWWRVKVRWPDE